MVLIIRNPHRHHLDNSTVNSSAPPPSVHEAWHLIQLSKYSNCVANYSTEQQRHITDERQSAYVLYHGWIPLPLALIALLLATVYIAAVWQAVAQHRVSRKCYVLLLNRAIGDVSTCIIILATVAYVLAAREASPDVMQVMDVFIFGSFWAAMVSYVALSFLKLYAIARPLQYRIRITIRQCAHLIILSWFIFLLMTVYALVATALVKVPALSQLMNCKIETCLRPMYRLRNYLVVTVYAVTLACFIATVVCVRQADKKGSIYQRRSTYHNGNPPPARQKSDSDLAENGGSNGGSNGTVTQNAEAARLKACRFRFPLWKLTLNVSTFALLNLFYVVWAVWVLWATAYDRCYYQLHAGRLTKLLGLVRLTLLLRIAMDPVLAFFTDLQVRRSVLAMFHLLDRRLPFGLGISESGREENSSDAPATGCITLTASGSSQTRVGAKLSAASLGVLPNGGVSYTHRVHPAEKRRAATQRRKD